MERIRTNLWKKALIAIIAISLIFGGSIPAYAVEVAENYTDVGTLKIKKIAEDNDFLTLAVELDNNPGISTLELELSYDGSAFSLTEVDDKQILFFGSEEGSFIKSENLNANPQYCMWRKMEGNTTNNGELVSFKFSKLNVQESEAYPFTLQNVVGGYLDESQISAQTEYRQFDIGGYTYRTAQTETGAALARYDEDADEYDLTGSRTLYASASRSGDYYYLGTRNGDDFTEADFEKIESCTMTVEKDGSVVGTESISLTDGITRRSEIEGIDYGISYKESETGGEILAIYTGISFYLSAAAIEDYKAVCGRYTVKAEWKEDGQQYAAETEIAVVSGKVLSKIREMSTDETGVIDYLYAEDSEAEEGLKIYYSAFKTYTEDVWDEDTETKSEEEITETYIYTDSDVNGIFEFIGVDVTNYDDDMTTAIDCVFTKGDPLAFDSKTKVTPLTIHPQNIMEDMVGRTFTLKFKNNETVETVEATIENEDGDISLEENKLYAVETSGSWIANIDSAGNIKFHNKADLREWIQTYVEIKEDENICYVFAVYSDGKLQAVKLDTEKGNEYVQITSIDDYEYVLQGLQLGECVLYAQDDENLSISCKVGLPECGAYASRERSENTYLGDEFHFISARQKKSDDSEAYFYVMTPKYTWDGINSQSELTASLADLDDTKDSWEPENEEGISFTQDGTYTDGENGNTYYVWKATVQKEYVNDQKMKYILVRGNPETDSESGETYYRYEKIVNLKIYDSAEIPDEEQLYWVYSYRCKLSEDGKLVPVKEEDDFGQWNAIEEPWDYGACLTKGYLAIRQTENGETAYYAMKQISIADELQDSITCADETGFLYNIEYNVLGSYRISAEYGGQQYSANIVTKLPYIGFYKTSENSVENGNLLGNELYFNALAQNENGTEAYFYVITGEPFSGSEIKTNNWYGDGEEMTVAGLSFEDCGKLDNGCHIWKVTLSADSFKTSEFGIAVGYTERRIKIYDASTKTKEQQLYWIGNYNVESISETDGQIEAYYESDFTSDKIDTGLWIDESGYFAIFDQGNYYAINPTTLPDEISRCSESGYLYEIENYGSKTYEVKYEDNQQVRSGTFQLCYLGMDILSSLEIKKENLLRGRIKFKELPKDENGDASFYVIASELGQNQRLVFGKWVTDEDGSETMEEVSVTGLSISESYGTIDYGEQKLLAWKVTIDKEDYAPEDGRGYIEIFTESDDETYSYPITIYSNFYVEPPEQLYWFNYDENIQVDSKGIISLKNEKDENQEDIELEWFVYSGINRTLYGYASGCMQGYFAILRDGQYQAVDIADESYTWISKSGDTPHLYEIGVPTEAIKTQILYESGEERYAMDYRYSLPYIGLSSDKDNLWTNYIESEDIWLENLPKDENGYRYIYMYERENRYSEEKADQIPEGRACYVDNDGTWIDVTEIRLEKVGFSAPEYAGEKYFVFKALIPDDFEWDEERELEFECPAQRYCISVRIHDQYSVEEDDQLYIVPAYTVKSVDDDGKMVIKSEWNVRKKAELTVKTDESQLYFAIKKDGTYYAVTLDEDSLGDDIRVAKNTSENQYYYSSLTAEKSGKYLLIYKYGEKEYKMCVTAKLPDIGIYSKSVRTDDTYIENGEIHFIDAAEGTETEKYFYLIAEKAKGEEDAQLCLYGEDKPLNIDGIVATNEGTIQDEENNEYNVWKLSINKDFRSDEYSGVSYLHFRVASEDYSQIYNSIPVKIYDSLEVPAEQQLYFFRPYNFIEIKDGTVKVQEGRTEKLEGYAQKRLNINYGSEAVGYLAVYENGEYKFVSQTASEGSVSADYISTENWNRMHAIKTGDYEIRTAFAGKNYYMRGSVSLPEYGFYNAKERSEAAFIKEYTYDKTKVNNHFYYIVPKEDFASVDLKDIAVKVGIYEYSEKLQMTVLNPVEGVSLGESGIIKDNNKEYYFWEFKLSKEYETPQSSALVFALTSGDRNWQNSYLYVYRNLRLGDVDENNKIDYADVLYFKRYLAEWSNYKDVHIKTADLNADGKIDDADVMILERHIAGWTGYDTLPKVS